MIDPQALAQEIAKEVEATRQLIEQMKQLRKEIEAGTLRPTLPANYSRG